MATTSINVNPIERRVSAILGGVLLLRALSRRSLFGAVMAIPLLYRGVSGHSYLYQALGVDTATGNGGTDDVPEVQRSITIEKPADELYRLWRSPQGLSQIMGDLGNVTEGSNNRTHWQVRAPFDRNVEWDTQIVEDRPGELIRWEAIEGSSFPNEGSIQFRPAPRDWGTEVTLHFRFSPPGGALGNTLAKSMSIVPRMFVEKALRRFKSLAETGEIPSLQRNPAARPGSYVEHASAH